MERLKQLEIELILADGTVYPLKGQILRAGPADWPDHRARSGWRRFFPIPAMRFVPANSRGCG